MKYENKVTELAKEFGAVLKEWLTGEQMLQVISTNREDINASWCASHDFCDANMAMDAAFQKVMGREFVFFNDEQPETEAQNGEDTDLINAAWTLAKKNDFYYNSKQCG
jgi:hypothetical protein